MRRRGGLGTGLAAIIPAAAMAPPHPALATILSIPRSDDDHYAVVAHRDVILVTLEVMRETLELDYCAYLHQGVGDSTRLAVCSRPELSPAPDGFRLLGLMKRFVETDQPEQSVILPGCGGVLFLSSGARSRGVHFLPSVGTPLNGPARDAARSMCRLYGSVIHRLEERGSAPIARDGRRP